MLSAKYRQNRLNSSREARLDVFRPYKGTEAVFFFEYTYIQVGDRAWVVRLYGEIIPEL